MANDIGVLIHPANSQAALDTPKAPDSCQK